MHVLKMVVAQPRGVIVGFVAASALLLVAFGLAFASGRVLATHGEGGTVHACVDGVNNQTRIMLPGQPPTCRANEELVEWAGADVSAALTALQAQVDALGTENTNQQTEIDELVMENSDQQTTIDSLVSANTTQQGQINDLTSDLMALDTQVPNCLFDASGTALFSGCNVQIVNGEGLTEATTGTGNLIIGYNEDFSFNDDEERSGSHNLVVGIDHTYSSYGGFVTGLSNNISGGFASVSGGENNTADGNWSSVSGGLNHTISFEGFDPVNHDWIAGSLAQDF